MKTTTITEQQKLEEMAIDAMIAYERRFITREEMDEAINRALRYYVPAEGHREIVLKGWIIKTIYALDRRQLDELERIVLEYTITETANNKVAKYSDQINREPKDKVNVIRTSREMSQTTAYKSGNWEVVIEHIAPAPGDGGAHLYAIHAEDVRRGEWIYDAEGNYIAERIT